MSLISSLIVLIISFVVELREECWEKSDSQMSLGNRKAIGSTVFFSRPGRQEAKLFTVSQREQAQARQLLSRNRRSE